MSRSSSSKERVTDNKRNIGTARNTIKVRSDEDSQVNPLEKNGVDLIGTSKNNSGNKINILYPFDYYLVPEFTEYNNSNYLQLSNFREFSHDLDSPSNSPTSSEAKDGSQKRKDVSKPDRHNQAQKKPSILSKHPSTSDPVTTADQKAKLEEMDHLMLAIRKQIMQIELNIPKMQAEMQITESRNSDDKNEMTPNNNQNISSRNFENHQTPRDYDTTKVPSQCTVNTSKETCVCCSKPLKSTPSLQNENSEATEKRSSKEVLFEKVKPPWNYNSQKLTSTSKDSNERRNILKNCNRSFRDGGILKDRGLRHGNDSSFSQVHQQSMSDFHEYETDQSKSIYYFKRYNPQTCHNNTSNNEMHVELDNFSENESRYHASQIIVDSRPINQNVGRNISYRPCQDEEMKLENRKQNVGTNTENGVTSFMKPNAAVHQMISQEALIKSNAGNSTMHLFPRKNPILNKLNKSVLPGVDIRPELIVQSGPAIHIPAVSKFAEAEAQKKNVLLKEFVHIEPEREVIYGTHLRNKERIDKNEESQDKDVRENERFDNQFAVEKKIKENSISFHGPSQTERNYTDEKNVKHLLPECSQHVKKNVSRIDKHSDDGASNIEIQERLYNAVRTYSDKLNSQNNKDTHKQLKDTLQDLSFNISRLYNNQMNEYVKFGKSRDVQAPLSYRMKTVAELLWEELELRTYPSEEHYSQIEEIIHHLVKDLEDAIKEDAVAKREQMQVNLKNTDLKNNYLDIPNNFKPSAEQELVVENVKKTPIRPDGSNALDKKVTHYGGFQTPQSQLNLKQRTIKNRASIRNDFPDNKKSIIESRRTQFYNRIGNRGKTLTSQYSNTNQPQRKSQTDPIVHLTKKLASASNKSDFQNRDCSRLNKPDLQNRHSSETKQTVGRKQLCQAASSKKSFEGKYSIEQVDYSSKQPQIPQTSNEDEDLTRLKRINTLYKLNKKFHSQMVEEEFTGRATGTESPQKEVSENDIASSETHKNRECLLDCDDFRSKIEEILSSKTTDKDNVSSISPSNQSVPGSSNKIPDTNEIEKIQVEESISEDLVGSPNILEVSEAKYKILEEDEIVRLETVQEEKEEMSLADEEENNPDDASDESGRIEQENADESYEDDWEVDQDENSVIEDEVMDDDKKENLSEAKEVKSDGSSSSSSSSSSTISDMKETLNEINKSSKSKESKEGGTYIKEILPLNTEESLGLNQSAFAGLKLTIPPTNESITPVISDKTKLSSPKIGLVNDKKDEDFPSEKSSNSKGSKTFNVVKNDEIEQKNMETASSSVSSEILQTDEKITHDFISEVLETNKNNDDNNVLIPLSARSNATATMRDSVLTNFLSPQQNNGRSETSSLFAKENRSVKAHIQKSTENAMPYTSVHLSIPEEMEHLQNRITMSSNFESQELKITLELNKSGIETITPLGALGHDSTKSSGRVTDLPTISKAVNTEAVTSIDVNDSGSKVLYRDNSRLVEETTITDNKLQSGDLTQLRNRIEGLESTLVSTMESVLNKLSYPQAAAHKKTDNKQHVGVTCNIDKLRTIYSQTDFDLSKPVDKLVENVPSNSQSGLQLTEASNRSKSNEILDNKKGEDCFEMRSQQKVNKQEPKDSRRKIETQLSSSWSSSSVSILRLSTSEERSQSVSEELSEGELRMEPAMCSCSFGEIKMLGCSRCGPYGVKKLTRRRSYPKVYRSDGELSTSFGKRLSECSRFQSIESDSKKSDTPKKEKTTVQSKSIINLHNERKGSKSFSHVVEKIMDQLRREKLETKIKFKKSQEEFDVKFRQYTESLGKKGKNSKTSHAYFGLSSGAINEATSKKFQHVTEIKNFDRCSFDGRTKVPDVDRVVTSDITTFIRSKGSEKIETRLQDIETLSDQSEESEVAIENLQELDSASLFRLIRKRKTAQTKTQIATVNSENSDMELHRIESTGKDDENKFEIARNESDGQLNAKVESEPKGALSQTFNKCSRNMELNRVQNIEEELKNILSPSSFSVQEHGMSPKGVCDTESAIRTLKDLLDSDSSNATILTNTSGDVDRSEGQLL